METTINNEQRLFIIERLGFSTRNFACNLHEIPKVIKEGLEPNDNFKIRHFWNGELKRISKKDLNEMFLAHKIDFKIK